MPHPATAAPIGLLPALRLRDMHLIGALLEVALFKFGIVGARCITLKLGSALGTLPMMRSRGCQVLGSKHS